MSEPGVGSKFEKAAVGILEWLNLRARKELGDCSTLDGYHESLEGLELEALRLYSAHKDPRYANLALCRALGDDDSALWCELIDSDKRLPLWLWNEKLEYEKQRAHLLQAWAQRKKYWTKRANRFYATENDAGPEKSRGPEYAVSRNRPATRETEPEVTEPTPTPEQTQAEVTEIPPPEVAAPAGEMSQPAEIARPVVVDPVPDIASNPAKTFKTLLGKNIEWLRLQCGWSYDELNVKTGITKKAIIANVNRGTKARPSNLEHYATAFSRKLKRSFTVDQILNVDCAGLLQNFSEPTNATIAPPKGHQNSSKNATISA